MNLAAMPKSRITSRAAFLASGLLVLFAFLSSPACAQPEDDADLYRVDRALAEQSLDRGEFFKTFVERSLLIDGKRVHLVAGGQGKPVILLHGWPGSWQSWHKLMPWLAARHHVVAIDLPGFGKSDALSTADKKSIARHLHLAVRALGLDRPAIVGHDMGLPVAYAYAAQFRDEVSALVAIDSAVPGFGLATGKPDDIMIVTSQRNAWHIPLFMNVPLAATLLKGRESWLLETMTAHSLHNKKAIAQGDLADLVRAMTRKDNLRSSLAYYAAWFGDARDNAAFASEPLRIPALAIGAQYGFLAQHTAYSLRGVAADVVDIVIPQSGHFIAEERPLLLSQVLIAFFETPLQRSSNEPRQ